MRRVLFCLLAICISRPVLAGYPERLLDWEDISAPPGTWPPTTLVFSNDALYANGGREPGGHNPGVYRYDPATDVWAVCGLPDDPVRALYAIVCHRAT